MEQSTERPQVIRKLLYQYLVSMGIDLQDYQKYSRAPLNSSIFRLPNQSACQYITYFLFNKLDHAKCKERFKYLWPPTSQKKNISDFFRVAYTWLSELAVERPDAKIPKFTKSLFVSAIGDRICTVYLALARFILQLSMTGKQDSKTLKHPKPSAELKGVAVAVHSLMYKRLLAQYNSMQKTSKVINDKMRDCASALVSSNLKLKNNISVLKDQLAETKQELCKTFSKEDETDAMKSLEESNRELVISMSANWRHLDSVYQAIQPLKAILHSDFCALNRVVINGDLYQVSVPEALTKTIRTRLVQEKVYKIHENGKLDFLQLIKFFTIVLPTFSKRFKELSLTFQSGSTLLQKNCLQEDIEQLRDKVTRIESDLLPSFDKVLKEQEHLLETFEMELESVFIEGKSYCLQETVLAKRKKSLASQSSLNDSAELFLMNISTVSTTGTQESDLSSPELSGRVLERKLSDIAQNSVTKTGIAVGNCLWKSRLNSTNEKTNNFKSLHLNGKEPLTLKEKFQNDLAFMEKTFQDAEIDQNKSFLLEPSDRKKSIEWTNANGKTLEELIFSPSLNRSLSFYKPQDSFNASLLENQTLPECPEINLTSELDASSFLMELSD